MNFQFDAIKWFRDGGPCMWPLLFCSFIGLVYIIERVLVLLKAKGKLSVDDFVVKIKEIFKTSESKDEAIKKAVEFCNKSEKPLTNILKAGVLRYEECIRKNIDKEKIVEEIRSAIANAGIVEIPALEAHLPILETIGKIAPLLGLLGTITGMLTAFNVIALKPGGARPDELAGGISQALITTVAGLSIAIPVVTAYSFFRSRIDNYINEVEIAANDLIENLLLLEDDKK